MEWSITLKNVLIGSTLLGLIGGIIGCFAVLRRQSLIGDALAHATLPGIALAFLLTGDKSSLPLLFGALSAGVLGSLCIMGIIHFTRVKEDAAIGIVLSVFFGFGVVLITRVQEMSGGNKSGLNHFLFGQAATLLSEDLVVMGVLGGLVLATILLLYKEFKLLSFDPGFAKSLGFRVRALDILLTSLIVLVVVVGLRTVGVVLMIAALITPAAAARQWTDRLSTMLLLAGALGAGSGGAGALASSYWGDIPTGPAIVLFASLVLIISLLFAPRRGLLRSAYREREFRGKIRRENLLKDLYRIGEHSQNWDAYATHPEVMGIRGETPRHFTRCVRALSRSDLIEVEGDRLRLAEKGMIEARRIVRKHRLWELFLNKRLELPSDHVHRDADAMEHVLSDKAVAELDELLGHPKVDPHGRPIPREMTP